MGSKEYKTVGLAGNVAIKKRFGLVINKKKIASFEVIFSGQNLSYKLNRGSLHI